jgi:ATP-GRASP peptide maturase of grasp-with-spasm system
MKKKDLIVLFSDKYDYSTLKVTEYLRYWGENVVRINPEDTPGGDFLVAIANGKRKNIQISINGTMLSPERVKSIWFRRGGIFCKGVNRDEIRKDIDMVHTQLNQYLSAEQHTLNTFLYDAFFEAKTRMLGNPFLFNASKLLVLRKASLHGLDIPHTLVSTQAASVSELLDRQGLLVTKAIQDNFTPVLQQEGYGLLTQTIDKHLLSQLPATFFPSLFQERLDKRFDLRVFYLDGVFYSMAIHSQENEKTATDFRNYDKQNPNRRNIFDLPRKICARLKALLVDLRLNTASIDMVYTMDDRYVFLEINPVGQYDMVDKSLNFQLDKKIALWLIGR